MTCEACQEQMMDVLYGEEVGSRTCFEFFKHLSACGDCEREYLDFLQTRETLGRWNLAEVEPSPLDLREPAGRFSGAGLGMIRIGWPLLQKVAAGFLILVGAASILQGMGIWRADRLTVSEHQLMQLVNDMIVIRQAEERQVIGQALVNFADEMSLQQRRTAQEVSEQLELLMEHLGSLEEGSPYVKASSKR